VAGEHYVLSELLRQGYIAALAPAGVPNADIVVTDMDGSRLCSIQVKTRRGTRMNGGWPVKANIVLGERYFFCFVDFQEPKKVRPLIYVMPAAIVAKAITESHQKWLSTPGRKGQPHKDNPVRVLLPDCSRIWTSDNPYPKGWLEQYQDAWDILGLEKTDPEKPLPSD
jgi:hypothetical protein